jgi:hypothetical protein
MRFVWTLGVFLLLVAVSFGAIQARSDSQLIFVQYQSWDQLQTLDAMGLQILNYQGDVLVALGSASQIERVRQAGFEMQVVDEWAAGSTYYLARPFRQAAASALCAADAAYPYGEETYLVKATTSQAQELSDGGVDLAKLPVSVPLPDQPPLSARLQSSGEYSSTIEAMVHAVSPTLLTHHVCKLQDDDSGAYCNEEGSRNSYDTAGLDEAAQYLRHHYESLGLSVTLEPFIYSTKPMTNVIAELPGIGPDSEHVLILCAHYDSRAEDMGNLALPAPGADDNASGSAAVLEAARILSQHTFPRTLRFVHFAGEEQGLIGSNFYALRASLRGDVIDGVINLDMIGYESVPPGDHIVEIHAGTMPDSIALSDVIIDNISTYSLSLSVQKMTTNATNRSDHASFWRYGYPAVLGIEDFGDFNPHYHSTEDTLAHMQTEMMVEYTKACVASLAELASQRGTLNPTPTPTHTALPQPRYYLPIVLRAPAVAVQGQ